MPKEALRSTPTRGRRASARTTRAQAYRQADGQQGPVDDEDVEHEEGHHAALNTTVVAPDRQAHRPGARGGDAEERHEGRVEDPEVLRSDLAEVVHPDDGN